MWTAVRRFLLCTAAFSALIGPASAQTLTAGARAGIDISSLPHAGEVVDQISGAPSVDVSTKLGLTGGGFVRFDLNERYAFQPELLFVMKGAKLEQSANAGTVTASVNYLEFPLLMRYSDLVSPEVRGFAVAGPAFAFTAGTSADLDGPDQTRDLNIDPAIRARDIGLVIGGGLEYDRYLLDVRYTLGLTDIANSAFAHTSSIKNRTFAITVGMTFR